MTRLIDADRLKKALKGNCKPELCHDYNTAWCEHCCRTNDFEDLIDNAPTVEPQMTELEEHFYHRCGFLQGMEYGKEIVRPQDKWSLVEHKKNIDLVCPCCGYHRCNLAYGFSIEEVREQIKEDKSNDYLLPDFCERCGAKLGFGGDKE